MFALPLPLHSCTSSSPCTNCSPRDRDSLISQVFIRIVQSRLRSVVFFISVIFTACDCSSCLQEIGRAIGIALMKQFGWRADLRNPDLEVVVLLCQVACCFWNCPWYLLVCSLLPLSSGPLAVCLFAAEFT